MLVDIAANNVPDQTKFCCVEFIFRRGKMCKFNTLCDRLIEFECLPSVEFVVCFIGKSAQNRVKVSNNHFPRPLISPY